MGAGSQVRLDRDSFGSGETFETDAFQRERGGVWLQSLEYFARLAALVLLMFLRAAENLDLGSLCMLGGIHSNLGANSVRNSLPKLTINDAVGELN